MHTNNIYHIKNDFEFDMLIKRFAMKGIFEYKKYTIQNEIKETVKTKLINLYQEDKKTFLNILYKTNMLGEYPDLYPIAKDDIDLKELRGPEADVVLATNLSMELINAHFSEYRMIEWYTVLSYHTELILKNLNLDIYEYITTHLNEQIIWVASSDTYVENDVVKAFMISGIAKEWNIRYEKRIREYLDIQHLNGNILDDIQKSKYIDIINIVKMTGMFSVRHILNLMNPNKLDVNINNIEINP